MPEYLHAHWCNNPDCDKTRPSSFAVREGTGGLPEGLPILEMVKNVDPPGGFRPECPEHGLDCDYTRTLEVH